LNVDIREVTGQDHPAIVQLLAASMGQPATSAFGRLLRWKHEDNPFGRSLQWVMVADGEIVGYRAFMRWEFAGLGRTWRAVRAVDTATRPDHQGKGVFKALTLHSLDVARDGGVDFVFNTPNDQSRPRYLKMGWEVVGTLRPWLRPAGIRSLPAIVRGRVPAGHWGEPTDVGERADDAFTVDAAPRLGGPLATNRTVDYLRWRYPADLLGYRVLGLDDRPGARCAFRLRRRGTALEATVGDVVGDDGADRRALLRHVLRRSGADYLLVLDGAWHDRVMPLPAPGPTLVWRGLRSADRPMLDRWVLTMGDIELF
jgi:GNAT superfamily N-acetyltransferase